MSNDFRHHEKKKMKKSELEKKASKQLSSSSSWVLPTVTVIGKGKKAQEG
jgi:hypothetical protein